MTRSAPRPISYPLVVISDAHLGMVGTRAGMLLEFLGNLECDQLVINGDLIDGERLAARRPGANLILPEVHLRVFDALQDLIARGTRIIYIPGNHDDRMRHALLYAQSFEGLAVKPCHVLRDLAGRRLLLTHGDQFTPQAMQALSFNNCGHAINDALLQADSIIDSGVHGLCGRHFSVAVMARRVANRFLGLSATFERNALGFTREQPIDGIICGHIHDPALHLRGESLYANSGDWVQHASALAMDIEGQWTLIDWMKERKSIGLRAVPGVQDHNPHAAFRPGTERLIGFMEQLWPGIGHLSSRPVGKPVAISL